MNLNKAFKLINFIGPTSSMPPLFLNSMPKAGTNLMENFLLNIGYRRSWSRCLNESNIHSAVISPKKGRFYIGHLCKDDYIFNSSPEFLSIFLMRDIWGMLLSYVNYMAIDKAHISSNFLNNGVSICNLRNLFFTKNNPNNRPLVDEYLRFHDMDLDRYTISVNFVDIINVSPILVSSLAKLFSLNESFICDSINKSLSSNTYTKNSGKINILSDIPDSELLLLKNEVEDYVISKNLINY